MIFFLNISHTFRSKGLRGLTERLMTVSKAQAVARELRLISLSNHQCVMRISQCSECYLNEWHLLKGFLAPVVASCIITHIPCFPNLISVSASLPGTLGLDQSGSLPVSQNCFIFGLAALAGKTLPHWFSWKEIFAFHWKQISPSKC